MVRPPTPPTAFSLDNALAENIVILAQMRYHPSMIDKHYSQSKEGLCQYQKKDSRLECLIMFMKN